MPQPFDPLPSPRQLAWRRLKFYGFIHFTVKAFTGRERGRGDEAPSVFNPTDGWSLFAFSADQIAETGALRGMKGLILTAKHHDV